MARGVVSRREANSRRETQSKDCSSANTRRLCREVRVRNLSKPGALDSAARRLCVGTTAHVQLIRRHPPLDSLAPCRIDARHGFFELRHVLRDVREVPDRDYLHPPGAASLIAHQVGERL